MNASWLSESLAIVLACGAGILLALGAWLLPRWISVWQGARIDCPARLFGELCKVHRLSRREAALLQRLARLHKLEQPARLFLESCRFDSSAAELHSTPAELQDLKRRLFGELGENFIPASR